MSALQLVRDEVGCTGADLVVAVGRLTQGQISQLAERVRSSGWFEPPSPRRPELWPLVCSRMSTFTAGGANDRFVNAPGPAGLNLWASLDPRFAGTGRFPSGVLRALLYCHGLV